MKVRLEAERCTGHGRCYELAPDVFGEDERGHCRVLQPAPPPALGEAAQRAAANCPERAIVVEDG